MTTTTTSSKTTMTTSPKTTTTTSSDRPTAQPPNCLTDLTWKVHLVKNNPRKGIAVFVFIIVLSFFSGIVSQSILIATLALIVLLVSTSQYFIPITYYLSDDELRIETPFQKKTRKWTDFKRWEKDKKSIKLLTMKNSSRLDNYRAWLLITEGSTRDLAEKFIQEKLG